MTIEQLGAALCTSKGVPLDQLPNAVVRDGRYIDLFAGFLCKDPGLTRLFPECGINVMDVLNCTRSVGLAIENSCRSFRRPMIVPVLLSDIRDAEYARHLAELLTVYEGRIHLDYGGIAIRTDIELLNVVMVASGISIQQQIYIRG